MTFLREPYSEHDQRRKYCLHYELQTACRIALRAGDALRRLQNSKLETGRKGAGEIVTNADRESNTIICDGLAQAFPADTIFSEELECPASFSSPRVWIVDPLDSTSNYVTGGNEYTVSIGLSVEGEAVLGVVYNPIRAELFAGGRGLGATLNRVPIRPSFVTLHHQRLHLLVSSKEWNRGLDQFARLMVLRPMASMAYKLARVAAGMDDGALSLKPRKPWGTCAGAAIVLSAGGLVTSADGKELLFPPSNLGPFPGLVASSRWLHSEVLKLANSLRAAMAARSTA